MTPEERERVLAIIAERDHLRDDVTRLEREVVALRDHVEAARNEADILEALRSDLYNRLEDCDCGGDY